MKKLVAQLLLCGSLVLPSAVSRPAHAEKHPTNACGCYGELNACFCEKKAKCGCPGECEPKGCEEQRQKKLQKEIDEETKKAREAEKVQEDKAKEDAKAKEHAKPDPEQEESTDETATSQKKSKAGKGAKHKMTSAQKKQLRKLIDVFVSDDPDSAQKTLSEVRKDL